MPMTERRSSRLGEKSHHIRYNEEESANKPTFPSSHPPMNNEHANPDAIPPNSQPKSLFSHKNWTLKEKIKLLHFLSKYEFLDGWFHDRKSIYIYKQMSKFIVNKTPEQCKNMHSLLKRKSHNIRDQVQIIIDEVQHEENYRKYLKKYENSIAEFEERNPLLPDRYEPIEYYHIKKHGSPTKIQILKKQLNAQNNEANFSNKLGGQSEQIGEHATEKEGEEIENEELKYLINEKSKILEACNFHFKEWLAAANLLKMRKQAFEQSSKQDQN